MKATKKLEEHKGKKAALPGLTGQLEEIKDDLLKWLFKWCKTGIAFSHFLVIFQASYLSPEFAQKSPMAKMSVMHHFLKKHSLVYCLGTHESQKPPEETLLKSLNFLKVIHHQVTSSP